MKNVASLCNLVLLSQDTFRSPTTAKKNSGKGRKARKHWAMTEQLRLDEVQLGCIQHNLIKGKKWGKNYSVPLRVSSS